VTVTLTDGRSGHSEGVVRLELPPMWDASDAQVFALDGEDMHRSFTFEIRPPRDVRPGRYVVRAVATVGRASIDRATELVDYPHIRSVAYVREAVLRIEMADLALPRVARIGYVRGAADLVPETLRAVGLPLVLLTADDLEKGDLSRYDAIVVGSRAYETTPALLTSNGRLLDYARQGGRLIVQYQQYPFVRGDYAPFRLTIASPHHRRDGAGDRGRPLRRAVPQAERDRCRRLGRVGPGARALLRPRLGPGVPADAGNGGRGGAAPRRPARRAPRPRALRLQRAQLLPAAPRGRAGGVPAVRQSAGAAAR
jgi:hypothetical protein